MFDLLIFTQYPKTYGPRRFLQEAKNLGYRVQVIGYSEAANLQNLPESKFVILREPTASKNIYNLRDSILNYYISKNKKVLNSNSYLKWSILDKVTQHNEFIKGNIPHISPLKLSEAKYPFVVKNKLGSHGDSVYKITTKEDLDRVLLKHKAEDLLCQEFQTSGYDLRVIVLGGRVLGIMKRTPREGEFLSNFSQGGEVSKFSEISNMNAYASIIQLATKAAKHFKLDYVGVDLMMGNDGEWKVLEVNRACQFEGFEKATGVNIASEVIKFLNL